MKRLMRVPRSLTWTPILWLIPIALVACRGEAERSAVARDFRASGAETTRASADRAPGGSDVAPPARLRRLWAGEDFNFYASSPSPDGRWVTEIDWSTGDLAVRDLTTGSLHRLTHKASWQDSGDYALFSTFSPDGDRVAYVWWNGERQRHELRILDFAVADSGVPQGSDPHVVYSKPGLDPYSVFDWSGDDHILGTVRRPDKTTALALISIEDGQASVLESFDWRLPSAARSPDGRFVAYDFPRHSNGPERDIHLLSTDGTRKMTLVEGPENHVVLGWVPDDGSLLFASGRSGRTAVWRLQISDGVPSGPPELLRDDVLGRIAPLGFAGRAFYFGVVVESSGFRVGDLDLDGGRLLGGPSPVGAPHGQSTHAWDWSPDGRHYAVAAQAEPPGSGFRVVIGSVDGTPVKSFQGAGRIERLRWGPDRQTVFFYGYDETGRPGIRALDLALGEIRTVRRFERTWGAMGGHFTLTPDGEQVYLRLLAPDGRVSTPTEGAIVALDLKTGAERRIRAVNSGGSLALSPDGQWLAFVDHDPDAAEPRTLMVIPADGGERREVFRQTDATIIDGLNWTPDGLNLVFLGGSVHRFDLQVVPAAGGDAEKLVGVPPLTYAEPRLHPDGHSIAFRSGENRGEIWVLENIPPLTPTSSEDRRR